MKEQTITLEQMRFGAREMLTPMALENLQYDERLDPFSMNLIRELRTAIWAEQVGEQTEMATTAFPSSWWQMFKRDVLKMDFKERVISIPMRFKVMAAYPQFALARPDAGPVVMKVVKQFDFE